MIKAAIFGDEEAAAYAAKRGIAVYSTEPNIVSAAEKNGYAVFFGKEGNGKLKVYAEDDIEAIRLCVLSADVVIAAEETSLKAKLAARFAKLLGRPLVEASGKAAVEKAIELLVRYNLFGRKE